MSHRCLDGEDLAALLDLAPDDALRASAEACPRCGSLLAAMDSFIRGDEAPGGDEEDAMRRLDAFVGSELTRTGRRRRTGRLTGPRRILLAAMPAVAAAVLVIFLSTGDEGPVDPGGQLRAGSPETAAVTLLPAQDGDGSIELRWQPFASAGQYRVELFTVALDTLLVARTDDTRFSVPAGVLADARASEGFLYRVRALADGRPVASSRIETFRID